MTSQSLPKARSQTSAAARLLWVDALRGLAIVLMVVFHFCYDLRYFSNLPQFSGYFEFAKEWRVPNGAGWRDFRFVILALFISTMGFSLQLAHGRGIRLRPFLIRLAQISGAALLLTLMSLVMFPNSWIFFGILHFIAFASLVSLALVRFPVVALVAGVLIVALYLTDMVSERWPVTLFLDQFPPTEDYVSLFPWLGVAFLGVAAAALTPLKTLDIPGNFLTSGLAKAGRHSLVIYLIHQPILFAGIYLYRFLFPQ